VTTDAQTFPSFTPASFSPTSTNNQFVMPAKAAIQSGLRWATRFRGVTANKKWPNLEGIHNEPVRQGEASCLTRLTASL
jgi:hypothetical protein